MFPASWITPAGLRTTRIPGRLAASVLGLSQEPGHSHLSFPAPLSSFVQFSCGQAGGSLWVGLAPSKGVSWAPLTLPALPGLSSFLWAVQVADAKTWISSSGNFQGGVMLVPKAQEALRLP